MPNPKFFDTIVFMEIKKINLSVQRKIVAVQVVAPVTNIYKELSVYSQRMS